MFLKETARAPPTPTPKIITAISIYSKIGPVHRKATFMQSCWANVVKELAFYYRHLPPNHSRKQRPQHLLSASGNKCCHAFGKHLWPDVRVHNHISLVVSIFYNHKHLITNSSPPLVKSNPGKSTMPVNVPRTGRAPCLIITSGDAHLHGLKQRHEGLFAAAAISELEADRQMKKSWCQTRQCHVAISCNFNRYNPLPMSLLPYTITLSTCPHTFSRII